MTWALFWRVGGPLLALFAFVAFLRWLAWLGKARRAG